MLRTFPGCGHHLQESDDMTNSSIPLLSTGEIKEATKDVLAVLESYGIETNGTFKKHMSRLIDEVAHPKKSKTIERKTKALARFSKSAVAAHSIEDFDKNTYLSGLTYGEFSLIDLIQATLDITGPSEVVIATWSSGFYDLEQAHGIKEDGRITKLRFVMDSDRMSNGQADPHHVVSIFGEESIVTARVHAKFVLIKNDAWNVIITSSMNLNKNLRVEQFEIVDDETKFNLFADFVDIAFNEAPKNGDYGRTPMPMRGMAGDPRTVKPVPGIARNTKPIAMGKMAMNKAAG